MPQPRHDEMEAEAGAGMTNHLRIVALDLSLRATGIAVTHSSDGEPRLSCRTVVTAKSAHSPTLTDHVRLGRVFEQIATAVGYRLGGFAWKPHLVVVEWQPQIEGHGDASLRIAELHGMTKHWLYSRSIIYVDVRPQELKTYATGNANADKDRVRNDVMGRYQKPCNIHIRTHDEADATALLALALDAYGQPIADVPLANRKAVGRVTWPKLTGDD